MFLAALGQTRPFTWGHDVLMTRVPIIRLLHADRYVFRARGRVKGGVVTFSSVAPIARQGVCRSGANEPEDMRRHWAVGCFCH